MHPVSLGFLQTPWAWQRVTMRRDCLQRIEWIPAPPATHAAAASDCGAYGRALSRYLQAPREDVFAEVPLDLQGTEFQLRVWGQLRQIACGQVMSYGQLAARLGSGARAVANACRANPLPLLIPCHRVVSADGLGGYAGATSGPLLLLKRRLLRHEGYAGRLPEE